MHIFLISPNCNNDACDIRKVRIFFCNIVAHVCLYVHNLERSIEWNATGEQLKLHASLVVWVCSDLFSLEVISSDKNGQLFSISLNFCYFTNFQPVK